MIHLTIHEDSSSIKYKSLVAFLHNEKIVFEQSPVLLQTDCSTQLPPSDDFLASDDLFAIDDDVYICTGVVHDDEKIYGRAISTFESSPKEKSFGFAQVTMKWRRQLS
jgi:hypothetical protein